jgi:hypothetical protein
MEATMRKFFLITVVLSSATTAHAGLYVIVADADVGAPVAIQPIEPLSAQRPDASARSKTQKMIMEKQMMIRKQMAMQREMQRHPIPTRLHFALLKFKRKIHYAFR